MYHILNRYMVPTLGTRAGGMMIDDLEVQFMNCQLELKDLEDRYIALRDERDELKKDLYSKETEITKLVSYNKSPDHVLIDKDLLKVGGIVSLGAIVCSIITASLVLMFDNRPLEVIEPPVNVIELNNCKSPVSDISIEASRELRF